MAHMGYWWLGEGDNASEEGLSTAATQIMLHLDGFRVLGSKKVK